MSKTIKELAESLGVTKTTIRNYMDDDFRAKYTEKDSKGVIAINDDGCKLIAESIGKFAETAESSAEKFAETEFVTIPVSVLKLLEEQISQKDIQLAEKDRQIADLTEAVKSQAQSINADRHNELAGTMQQFLPGEKQEPPEKEKGFFAKLFGW